MNRMSGLKQSLFLIKEVIFYVLESLVIVCYMLVCLILANDMSIIRHFALRLLTLLKNLVQKDLSEINYQN